MSNAIALILCQMLWHLAIAGCFTTQLLHCNQLLNLDVLLAGHSNLSITWVPLFIACCLPGGFCAPKWISTDPSFDFKRFHVVWKCFSLLFLNTLGLQKFWNFELLEALFAHPIFHLIASRSASAYSEANPWILLSFKKLWCILQWVLSANLKSSCKM